MALAFSYIHGGVRRGGYPLRSRRSIQPIGCWGCRESGRQWLGAPVGYAGPRREDTKCESNHLVGMLLQRASGCRGCLSPYARSVGRRTGHLSRGRHVPGLYSGGGGWRSSESRLSPRPTSHAVMLARDASQPVTRPAMGRVGSDGGRRATEEDRALVARRASNVGVGTGGFCATESWILWRGGGVTADVVPSPPKLRLKRYRCGTAWLE